MVETSIGLSSSDPGADEHLLLCELLGHGTQCDQLNLPGLALGKGVSRRLQLSEERHAEKLRASTAGDFSAVPRKDISCWAELDPKEAPWWP